MGNAKKHIQMKNLLTLALAFIVAMLLQSCSSQFDFETDKLSNKIDQTSDWAIPLVNAEITLSEILEKNGDIEQYLITNDDGFLTLIFEEELTQLEPGEFFDEIPTGGEYSGTIDETINYSIETQVLELGLDKFLNEGSFYISGPKVIVTLRNYWDIGARFKLTDFYYYEEATSDPIALTGPITEWTEVTRSTAGEEALTVIRLENSDIPEENTNIDELISAMPHHISFGADFETTVPNEAYTVPENAVNTVDLRIEIPLDLSFENLVLTDTLDFSLGEDLNSDTAVIESFSFKVNVNNGFPFELASQIYFADENYVVIDSISNEGLSIVAGNSTNGTNSPVLTENEIVVEKQKISNLIKSKYLIPRFEFNSRNASSGETVKLYPTYAIGLKLGARAKFKIKTD
jgi:hypothetical protein